MILPTLDRPFGAALRGDGRSDRDALYRDGMDRRAGARADHRACPVAAGRGRAHRLGACRRGAWRARPAGHPSGSQARELHVAFDRRGSAARLRLCPPCALSRLCWPSRRTSPRARPPTCPPSSCRTTAAIARSDLFALGVLLYELATGRQPFGEPQTYAGMRDRLWREPVPPRALNERVPPWLQEIILRCLEPSGGGTLSVGGAYRLRPAPSGAGCAVGARGSDRRCAGFFPQFGRWWRSRSRQACARRAPTDRRSTRTGDHGRGGYRASGRRAPSIDAIGDAAAGRAQSGISPDVRIGGQGGAAG